MRDGKDSPGRRWRVLLLSGLLGSGHAFAAGGVFEKNHPLVAQGSEAYAAGKYEEALKAFDEAQKVLPSTPEVEFNRADALAKLGRTQEAKEAFLKAAQSPSAELRAKAHYNLGNLYAQSQPPQREEAIRAYRKALLINPKDEDARHNLQTVLQNKPPEPPKSDAGSSDAGSADAGFSDGGSPDGGAPDGGLSDGGTSATDGGSTDGGMSQSGPRDGGGQDAGDSQQSPSTQGQDGGVGDAGSQAEQDAGQRGTPDAGGSVDGGMAEREDASDGGVQLQMSREEALRMLDAMKQNEKSLQRWKFQKKRPRKPNEKDW